MRIGSLSKVGIVKSVGNGKKESIVTVILIISL